MTSRINAAQRSGDNSGRIPMPLAPSTPGRAPKQQKSGYRKVKKVAPRPAPGQKKEEERRSPLLFVVIGLLGLVAIVLVVVNSGKEPAADESVVAALSGNHFLASAAFGIDLPEASALAVEFWAQDGTGGTLAVSGGCNAIGGAYRIENGSTGIGSFFGGTLVGDEGGWSQTEMACDEPLMALDAAVVDLISNAPRITLVDTTLTITGTLRTITFELDGPSSRAEG